MEMLTTPTDMKRLLTDRPDRQADDKLVSAVLDHGDKEQLAFLCEVDPSYITQLCNPYKKKYSWFSGIKRFFWALVQINPQAADRLFSDLEICYRRWRGLVPKPKFSGARLTKEILKQLADVVEAELDGRPLEEQISECKEAALWLKSKQEQLEHKLLVERTSAAAEHMLGMPDHTRTVN